MSATTLDAGNAARVTQLGQRVLGGAGITRAEALWLFDLESREDIFDLLSWANRIREHFKGNKVHLCSIVNIKAGGCSENCRFCAQSAAYQTGSPRYGLIDAQPPRRKPAPMASPRWDWWRLGAGLKKARCWTRSATVSKH